MLDIINIKISDRRVSIIAEDLDREEACILHLKGAEKKRFLWLIPYTKISHCYIKIDDHKVMSQILVNQFMATGSFIVSKPLKTHGTYVTLKNVLYQPRCFCGSVYTATPIISLIQAFNPLRAQQHNPVSTNPEKN